MTRPCTTRVPGQVATNKKRCAVPSELQVGQTAQQYSPACRVGAQAHASKFGDGCRDKKHSERATWSRASDGHGTSTPTCCPRSTPCSGRPSLVGGTRPSHCRTPSRRSDRRSSCHPRDRNPSRTSPRDDPCSGRRTNPRPCP